jgi:hypothetical protein
MAIKFDPTVTMGNALTAISVLASVAAVWGSLQGTLATHTTEIRALQDANVAHAKERTEDRTEIKELLRDLKTDVKDVRDTVEKIRSK